MRFIHEPLARMIGGTPYHVLTLINWLIVCCPLEEKGVRLPSFCQAKTSMKTCDGLVLSITEANETENFNDKHLVQTKPKGENTVT